MRSDVFNMDCLPAMREIPDKAFDLAIVDPPYSNRNQPTKNMRARGTMRSLEGRPTSEYFAELCRVSVDQIIWGGNYFLSHLSDTKCLLTWYKHQAVSTYADSEIAWTSFSDRHSQVFDYAWGGLSDGIVGRNKKETFIHPTQKPVALYKWLLTNYAEPGQTILDTHLGSGSSRIAAYDLGFDFVGYELDKDYFDAQEQRFARHIAQPKLFTPEPQAAQQEGLW